MLKEALINYPFVRVLEVDYSFKELKQLGRKIVRQRIEEASLTF